MTKLKIIFVLLVVSSCSYISYSEALPLLRDSILGAPDIQIDQKFIDSKKYSFAKIKVGRSAIAILSLASIDDEGVYKWVNSSDEAIYTFKGKIIKTEGILFDMNLYNYMQFLLVKNNNNLHYQIELTNPQGFFSQSAQISSQVKENQMIVSEVVTTDGFRWNYTNEYIVDLSSNNVIEAEQFIHPKYPKIYISYYYKF
ncbi:YjbF family lipoprotein [Gammaproteobacteria bacterium]|jgi:hypothetical protein|nr:YjbF family lipoprotein [Gammaproteobacteria bacterium]